MVTKYGAFGTELRVKDGFTATTQVTTTIGSTVPDSTDFTGSLASVSNISGPSLSLDVVDVTSHDSTDRWEEVVPTILRTGEIGFDLIFDPGADNHDKVRTAMIGRLKNSFALVFPDGTVLDATPTSPDTSKTAWFFDAYVTSFQVQTGTDGPIMASVGMKITGKPQFDYTTS